MLNQASERERASLGAAGPARVEAVVRWLRGEFGDTAARPFINTLVTSKQVDGWERIMQKMQSQGAGSFRRNGGEPPGDGRLTDEQYGKLSYTGKMDYASRMTARAERGGQR